VELTALPKTPGWIKGPTSKSREVIGEGKKGREERGRKGRVRDGRICSVSVSPPTFG